MFHTFSNNKLDVVCNLYKFVPSSRTKEAHECVLCISSACTVVKVICVWRVIVWDVLLFLFIDLLIIVTWTNYAL